MKKYCSIKIKRRERAVWWESHRLFCGHYHISHLQFHIPLQHATLLTAWLFLYTQEALISILTTQCACLCVCMCVFVCLYQTVRILTHHLFRYRFLLICKKAVAASGGSSLSSQALLLAFTSIGSCGTRTIFSDKVTFVYFTPFPNVVFHLLVHFFKAVCLSVLNVDLTCLLSVSLYFVSLTFEFLSFSFHKNRIYVGLFVFYVCTNSFVCLGCKLVSLFCLSLCSVLSFLSV